MKHSLTLLTVARVSLRSSWRAVSLCSALLLAPLAALHAADFQVATNGDDLNPGTPEKPFATLERARDAVREALPRASGDITVSIRAGVYRLERTLLLTEQDSGRDGVAVVWRSADGIGKARVSGSAPVMGWQRHAGKIWKIRLRDGADFQTMYEDGVRLRKARFPNYRHDPARASACGDYHVSESGSAELAAGDRRSWLEYTVANAPPATASLAQMKIQVFPWGVCDWHRWTCRVTGLDRSARRIEFDNLGDRSEVLGGARYFLEDDLAFLDAQGEFHLDRAAGVLYCIPLGNGHPDTLNFTAPKLLTLVELQGADRDHCVRNVRFEGLAFEETDAISPSLFWWVHDWGRRDHALVRLSNTGAVTIRNCHLRNSGRHGVLMVGHNVGNRVYGCHIEQVGISGITLSNRFSTPKGKDVGADRLEQNILCNNRIHDAGQLGLYASCIELMNVSSNEVCHSELFNSPRYAITMRGNPLITISVPPAKQNRLHHLRIHHCGQDSGDMGALHAAAVNNPGGDNINTYEQITIADTRALDSMMDIPPDAIFLDWPKTVMGQVFRDIQVVRAQGDPFRSNREENATSAVTENVSWKPGFDENRMAYAEIGVKADYPPEFGGTPAPPVLPSVPAGLEVVASSHAAVSLRWSPPANRLTGKACYTIYRDGQEIARTFATTFTDTAVKESSVNRYEVAARDGDFGPLSPRSAPCEVRVPVDTEPARLVAARATGDLRHVVAFFTKPLKTDVAATAAHFSLGPDVPVRAARTGASPSAVVIETSSLQSDADYKLRVSSVPEPQQARNTVEAGTVGFRTDFLVLHNPFDAEKSAGGLGEQFHGGAATVPVAGRTGRALRLDGRRAWVEGPADLNLGDGDFTLAAWIWKERSGSRVVLSKGNDSHVPGQWTWGWEYPPKANNIAFRSNDQYFASAPGSVPVCRWVHIAFVRRGCTATSYVNGALSGEPQDMSKVGDLTSSLPFLIGRRPYERSPVWFAGMIDDLRVYARALSADEIRRLGPVEPAPK
jgi:hypothetical protein